MSGPHPDSPMGILNAAFNDEDGAGFHVRIWLSGGQVVDNINVAPASKHGFVDTDRYLRGFRPVAADQEGVGQCSFRWADIIGLEIQW